MIKRVAIPLLFVIALCAVVPANGDAIDLDQARQYFHEADGICQRDDGRLWGKSLCGPILFVDPSSRMIVANQPDGDGHLELRDDVYAGMLPPEQNCANTAMKWAGVEWTMLIWPLPDELESRARLLVHELFHRIQDDLGLPARNPSNSHLDQLDGRVWLQLEWRALAVALRAKSTDDRRRAIADAVLFRDRRQQLFESALKQEGALELNEGLAEYTGYRLSGLGPDQAREQLVKRLAGSEGQKSYSRSFAYVTGPAWGLLLDAAGSEWRSKAKTATDFGSLASDAFGIRRVDDPEGSARRSETYGATELWALERKRDAERQERIAGYLHRLVDGPVLRIPLTSEVSYSFNPYNVESLGDDRIIYPTIRITDSWGVLSVENGALVEREDGRVAFVTIPAPKDLVANPLQGDGWTLEKSSSWKLEAGPRGGDLRLIEVSPSGFARVESRH